MSEFNEPWRVNFASGVLQPQIVIATEASLNIGRLDRTADADRIVACVNALAGVPTEDIERVVTTGKVILRPVDVWRKLKPKDGQ